MTRPIGGGGGRRWLSISWAVLSVCVAASVLGAAAWRSAVHGQQVRSFQAEATGIASTVGSSLARMDDLVATTHAYLALHPNTTDEQFRAWTDGIGAGSRYPGTLGIGFVVPVAAAGLGRFSHQIADSGRTAAKGRLTIIPPGSRATYCLAQLGAAVSPDFTSLPVGFDFCAFSSAFATARATGHFTALTLPSAPSGGSVFLLIAPLFGTTQLPAASAAKAAKAQTLRGWVVGAFDAGLVIKDALAQHRGFGVTVSRQDLSPAQQQDLGAKMTQFAGTVPAPTLTPGTGLGSYGPGRGPGLWHSYATVQADGSWLIEVTAHPKAAALTADDQGVLVLGLGVASAVLLFTLLQVLARGRGKALRLVDEKTDELRYRALHDGLTGLPNRVLTLDRAGQMLARGRREREGMAAMFIDLDGFKGINDSFGHDAGDQLLVTVAQRLSSVIRGSDTVGRLGGDEFVVLVDGLPGVAEGLAERMLDVLREPFEINTSQGETLVSLTASIGIAIARDGCEPAELLRDADIALYAAKADGRNRCAYFRPDMHTALSDRVALGMDLRGALAANQLYLEFQPIIDLNDGTITGVEALLRWQHPERGLIPPARFIPLAEDSGLIVDIGRWVLQQACEQGAQWNRAGYSIDMSVNLAATQLDTPTIVDDVRDALQSTGMDPAHLILEITETNLMRDAPATAARLSELKSLGVRIAIDDFGTGYSSLAYLQQFPVDTLKIDRSFVARLNQSSTKEARVLIHSLVQLGKSLGLGTLAEGIEDADQLAYLQQQQCDTGQGFLFGRPMSPTAVEELLAGGPALASRIPHPRTASAAPGPSGTDRNPQVNTTTMATHDPQHPIF